MTEGFARRLAVITVAISFALSAASVILIALHPATDFWGGWGFAGYDAAFALVFGAMGLLVAIRRPGNLVAWLFLASAVLSGSQTVMTSYSAYAVVTGWPGAAISAWIAQWIWLPSLSLVALILLLFPNGRLVSPRWRPVALALVPATVAVTMLWALAGPGDGELEFAGPAAEIDPLGLGPEHPLRTLAGMSTLVLAAALVAGAASLWSRMRRGDPIERQQIKWIAFAGALVGPGLAASVLTTLYPIDPVLAKLTQVLAIAAVLLIPVAAGIAILRYRLYDIDVLINRTIVYGATSAGLLATYLTSVLMLSALLRPLTGSGALAVAGSTLAVVALFAPLRRRIQSAVDRRFYRSRYDAVRTVDAFGARLRDQVDLDDLRAALLDIVDETLRPVHASLWLREARR